MQLTLYHYVHCPFCVRVRMALGYLQLPYKSVVVPYDDETTPVKLTGVKMLPIMEIDGKAMNESLDIIALLDKENKLKINEMKTSPEYPEFEALLGRLGSDVHSLAMPYWIWTPEFNDSSRAYFQKKKEVKRGPFKDLVSKQAQFAENIRKELDGLENKLRPFYQSDKFSAYDILIASHIWGLYVVPEFQFSESLHRYLQTVKGKCDFNYHQDFWR